MVDPLSRPVRPVNDPLRRPAKVAPPVKKEEDKAAPVENEVVNEEENRKVALFGKDEGDKIEIGNIDFWKEIRVDFTVKFEIKNLKMDTLVPNVKLSHFINQS